MFSKYVNSIFLRIDMPKHRRWVFKKLKALPFDSTTIRFDLEHHPLDINL